MYKIINNLSDLDNLNQIIQQRENNPDVKYCDVQKHPLRDEWIIPIDETLLEIYNPKNLKQLLSDNISEIPSEWEWVYENCLKRIIIPNYLILSNTQLRQLIQYCMENEVLNTVNKENTIVYVSYILPEHLSLFGMFEEIKIEEK